uniref:F-box domain-containing protein n=1 Tax=Ditylenchus dipsaci TaxID=166011 RepID=A0A915CQX8_9BILA
MAKRKLTFYKCYDQSPLANIDLEFADLSQVKNLAVEKPTKQICRKQKKPCLSKKLSMNLKAMQEHQWKEEQVAAKARQTSMNNAFSNILSKIMDAGASSGTEATVKVATKPSSPAKSNDEQSQPSLRQNDVESLLESRQIFNRDNAMNQDEPESRTLGFSNFDYLASFAIKRKIRTELSLSRMATYAFEPPKLKSDDDRQMCLHVRGEMRKSLQFGAIKGLIDFYADCKQPFSKHNCLFLLLSFTKCVNGDMLQLSWKKSCANMLSVMSTLGTSIRLLDSDIGGQRIRLQSTTNKSTHCVFVGCVRPMQGLLVFHWGDVQSFSEVIRSVLRIFVVVNPFFRRSVTAIDGCASSVVVSFISMSTTSDHSFKYHCAFLLLCIAKWEFRYKQIEPQKSWSKVLSVKSTLGTSRCHSKQDKAAIKTCERVTKYKIEESMAEAGLMHWPGFFWRTFNRTNSLTSGRPGVIVNSLIDDICSIQSRKGVEQQQQPKTNSPASSPAALNSTSSATKQTCVAAAGSVAGGVPGEPTAHSTPNKPTLSSAAMVRRLTGAARKRHQAQHVSAANQHQSTSSSSTTGRSSLQATGEALHLVNSNTNPRNSRHQPVQARHNQMYLITTLLPNGQSDPQALINRILPKELILRCAQVCRSWNKLAMDGSNWQSVDLFDFQKDVKTAVVESLARRCGDSAMRSFAAKCPNIERLSLNKCKLITDATCEFIGRYCHRLKELDLENCTAITDLTMKFISEGCKRLEELNISWCENITDRGIAYICRGSPNLHTLICKGCEGLSPSCFAQVNNDLKQLRKLSLLSCSNVTDETVEQLANGCNQLEFLCLSNCKEITDQALNAIAQGCPNIKDLELASCTNLTDTGFITLSKNCHELERMDLEDCSLITDAALLNLNNGCPNLSSLALSHCENLTDTGLAELCATHKDCLAVLELDNCPNITDAALDSMKTLKHLERVDLFDCQMITKDAIKKFKQFRPEVDVHAYFAPATPPVVPQPREMAFVDVAQYFNSRATQQKPTGQCLLKHPF